MKNIFLFKHQIEKGKDWWENNQERVKDEVTRVAVILAIIIFSPLIIVILIVLLIMAIEGEKMKEFFKKFIERLRQCAKETAFYCNATNLPYSPTMSEEERRKILKTDKYEE